MKKIELITPLSDDILLKLNSGYQVFLSGTVYTARDAAHKKLITLIDEKQKLPFELKGSIIFYVGPSPAPEGKIIGSAGPTSSYRMDKYTPTLIKQGVKAFIGKGQRSREVKKILKDYCAVYFAAIGGLGALISKSVVKSEVIAFPEIGAESIRRLEVENMPLTVVNDCHGNDLYDQGRKLWSLR